MDFKSSQDLTPLLPDLERGLLISSVARVQIENPVL